MLGYCAQAAVSAAKLAATSANPQKNAKRPPALLFPFFIAPPKAVVINVILAGAIIKSGAPQQVTRSRPQGRGRKYT